MRIKGEGFGANLGLPQEVISTILQSMTCEFAVRGRDGRPITYPMAAYPGRTGTTVDLSVGLVFPWKAELARRDPRVCVSWCRPVRLKDQQMPVVVLQGHAAVRDRDLQANTDHYLKLLRETLPGMFGRLPGPVARRLGFYLARIWIEVTPLRVLWWPDADLAQPPRRWEAPATTELPTSDPPPAPRSRPVRRSLFTSPPDWRPGLDRALHRLAPPILSVVGEDGYPVTFPANHATRTADGALLDLPASAPAQARGPACITFHGFQEKAGMPFQENYSFAGVIGQASSPAPLVIERQLLHGNLPNPFAMAHTFFNIWRMRSRLPVEASRRGQPVPEVHA